MYECKNLYYTKFEISQPAKMTAHEFHVPTTAGLPSLPATVFSRSDCDWAGVSLIVAEIFVIRFSRFAE